jgi:DNA repair exonuclease SbcCD ATPase subunit
MERLSKLEEERVQVLQTRRELFSQIVELNQSEERLQRLELERRRLRYLQTLAESQAIRQRLAAVDEADAVVNCCAGEVAKWQDWATFPVRLRDDVLRLTTQRNHLEKECSEAQQQAAAARERLQPIETQMAAIGKRVTALKDARDVPVGELPQVQDLANQWKVANAAGCSASERWRRAHATLEEAEQHLVQEQTQLEPAVKLGHAGLAAFQQQLFIARQRVARATESLDQAQAEWTRVGMDEAQFQQLERTVQEIQAGIRPAPKPRKGCKALLSRKSAQSADQTPTEVVIYAQIKPIYEGLTQSRAEAKAARQTLSGVEADIVNQLGSLIDSTLDDNAFARLGQRLESHLRAVANADQQKAAVANLKSELDADRQRYEAAHTALQTKLAELGFDATDVQVALDAYVKQCERKEQLERAESELERLRLQAQALERDRHDWHNKQAALEGVEAGLCTLLSQAGIECSTGTLETALVRFNDGADNYKRWAQAKVAYEAAIQHQDSLLDTQNRTRLETSLAEIKPRLAAMQARYPKWSRLEPDKTPQEYAASIQQTDEKWATAREECDRLRESIHLATSSLQHPAEIEEEISAVKAQIQRLEWFRDALELAREELTQATQEFQKQFAPKLESLVSEGLDRVTRGRYSEVQVDPNSLDVSLTAPELSRPVSVGQLSTGTRDLVYLMLRVAVARLMSRSEEKLPLFLDDPLVQFDRARQEQTLEFLTELAGETQVFLFTKDEWTKTWFEENLGSHSCHCMHLLP